MVEWDWSCTHFVHFGPSKVIWGNEVTERKEDKYVLWEYIYELWTLQRKIPSLVSLIASMVFNDSFGVEKYV